MEKAPLMLPNAVIFLGFPVIALLLIPYYGLTVGFDAFEWSMFALFTALTLHSISAGYHRLWSHKAFQARFIVRLFYAIWGACSLQNSILHWASDHRRHHKFVDDNDRDPYSATRGFWFSHLGWLFREYESGKNDFSNVKDLVRDPIVMWQHQYYLPLVLGTNVGLPVVIGYLHESAWGMFLLAGLFRLVVVHHFTFFINSLAHLWGSQPYADDNSSRDNPLLAVVTFGEGYHNYHHEFQYDYRNGVKWWHFDPTKWVVRTCSWVGLTSRLRQASRLQIQKAELTMQYKRAVKKVAHLDEGHHWYQYLEDTYDQFIAALEEWARFKQEWYNAKRKEFREKYEQYEWMSLKQRQAELKGNLKFRRRQWRLLTSQLAAQGAVTP